MQLNVNYLEPTKAQIDVVFSAEEAGKFYNESYAKKHKTIRMDGYRKGHVPRSVFEKSYGIQIGVDAANALINSFVQSLSKLEEVLIPRVAKVEVLPEQNGVIVRANEPFKFSIKSDAYPKLEDKDLKSVKLDLYKIEVSDDDVNEAIERVRKQSATYQVVDDLEIGAGTRANIDFLGKQNGVEFAGGKSQGFDLDVDTAQMIPGFTESIIGHKAGDEFTITCKFPDEYHIVELAGKEATFDIKVNSVAKLVLPEIDENLANIFKKGISVEDFKVEVRKNLLNQASNIVSNITYMLVSDKLKELYPDYQVPKSVIDDVATRFMATYLHIDNPKMLSAFKQTLYEPATEYAKEECKASAIFSQLLHQKKLSVDYSDDKINAFVESQSVYYEDPEEYKKTFKKDKSSKASVLNEYYSIEIPLVVANEFDTNYSQLSFFEAEKLYKELTGKAEKLFAKYAGEMNKIVFAQEKDNEQSPEKSESQDNASEQNVE